MEPEPSYAVVASSSYEDVVNLWVVIVGECELAQAQELRRGRRRKCGRGRWPTSIDLT